MCITYANAKPPHVNAEQKNCDKTVKWKNTKSKTTVNNGCILNTFSSDHKKMNWEMEGRTETERTFGTALQAEKGLSHCQHQFSATILASLSVSATVLTSFSHHPHVPLSLSWHLSLGLCHSPDVSLSRSLPPSLRPSAKSSTSLSLCHHSYIPLLKSWHLSVSATILTSLC